MTACLRAIALLLTLSAIASLLPAGPAALAQETTGERAVIEIIQIRHRDPVRVRDAVSAALDPRGRIGLIDDKLVVATTATNLRQLREIIVEADSPPRRLVVGVDFAYQAGAADSTTQQQSQAIEGESLVFVGRSADPDPQTSPDPDVSAEPDAIAEQPVSNAPRITITSEIVAGDTALINVSVTNFPELTGSHIARVPLGTWQPVMPADSTLQPDTPALAVRIDVVP